MLSHAHSKSRLCLPWLVWQLSLRMLGVSSVCSMAVDMPALPKQILVFGGNGFLGATTVSKLIGGTQLKNNYKFALVNRGNWYWDSAFNVEPFVQTLKCDRMNGIEKCTDLKEFVENTETIDVVIDFSAYHPSAMTESLQLLAGKAKFYIYISTDSVYEVCAKNHTNFTVETDAVRPTSEEMQASLQAKESYGHHKLECEEVLATFRAGKNGPPYVSLRLPDVVGPRDNSYRWWIYQLWMKLQPYLEEPVSVPSSLVDKPMSLVFAEDVADLIYDLVQQPPLEAFDEAFNLAMKETPSLMEMLTDIKQELNLTELEIATTDTEHPIQLYPSVTQGPIDISKAEEVFGWKPTEWKEVVKETVSFYEEAIKVHYFDRARKYMIRTMQSQFTTKPTNVIRGLRSIYGLSIPEPRDEL